MSVGRPHHHRAAGEARGCARADAGPEEQLLGGGQPAAAADDDRVALAVVAAPLLGDAAVAYAHDAVGDARRLGVVADDHGRAAGLPDELAGPTLDLVQGRAREPAR